MTTAMKVLLKLNRTPQQSFIRRHVSARRMRKPHRRRFETAIGHPARKTHNTTHHRLNPLVNAHGVAGPIAQYDGLRSAIWHHLKAGAIANDGRVLGQNLQCLAQGVAAQQQHAHNVQVPGLQIGAHRKRRQRVGRGSGKHTPKHVLLRHGNACALRQDGAQGIGHLDARGAGQPPEWLG
jgi:hypothetical protein